MTDWSHYQACTVCEAELGEPCYALLARGPQSLPTRYADLPHSSRKLRGARPRKPATMQVAAPAKSTGVARRGARKTNSTAAAWLALAEKQRRR
jgi:hypothetical protein